MTDASLPQSTSTSLPASGRAGEVSATRLREVLASLARPAHYLSLAIGLALILFLDRKTWFIGDEFEFFGRMQPGSSLAILVPHNGHWSSVPLLITDALYRGFGLRSVFPYNVVNVLAHVGVTYLLWRWMLRVGALPWTATGLAAVFLVVGGGVENLWSWFQISFVLPVGIGLLGAFLVDRKEGGPMRDVLFWPFGVIVVMSSGVGLVMVALAAGVALLRRGWWSAIRVASVPAAVYLTWLAAIGRHYPSRQPGPAWELTQVPQYMWSGITSAVDATVGLAGAGGILFIVLGIWLWRNRMIARTRAAMAFAAFVSVLLWFALLGYARVTAGIWEAALTRYGYVCIALLLPAAALALSRIARRTAGNVVVLSLCAVAVVNGVAEFETFLQTWNPVTADTKGVAVATARLLQAGVPLTAGNDTSIEPLHSLGFTVGMVRSMLATGKLTASGSVSPNDTLNAELMLQVGVGSAALAPADVAVVQPAFLPLITPEHGDCFSVASATASPSVGLVFAQPGAVSLTPQATGTLTLQLATIAAPATLGSSSVAVSIMHDVPSYVTDLAPGTVVRLSLPAGITQVCGVSSP